MSRSAALQSIRPASAIPHSDFRNTFSDYDYVIEGPCERVRPGEVHWIKLGLFRDPLCRRRLQNQADEWIRWSRKSKRPMHIELQADAFRIQGMSRPYGKVAHWKDLQPGQTMQLMLKAEPEHLEKALTRTVYLKYRTGESFEPFMAGDGLYLTRHERADRRRSE